MVATQILQAYDGWFGIGLQTDVATAVAPTAFTCFNSFSAGESRPNKAPIPQICGSRNYKQMQVGGVDVTPSLSMNLIPDSIIGELLACLYGTNQSAVTGGATTGYTHIFNEPTSSKPLLEEGVTLANYQGGLWAVVCGAYLNQMSITIAPNEIVTLQADWIARSVSRSALSGITPSYSAILPYEGWHAKLSIVSSSTPAGTYVEIPITQSITFTFNNKFEKLQGIGSRYLVGRNVGRPEVTIDLSKLLQSGDSTYLANFLNNTNSAVKLTLTHDDLAGTSSGAYSLEFLFPNCSWLGDDVGFEGEGSIEQPYKLQALQGEVTSYEFASRATLVNSESGLYFTS